MPVGVVVTCRSPEELIMVTALMFGGGFVVWVLIMIAIYASMARNARGQNRKR